MFMMNDNELNMLPILVTRGLYIFPHNSISLNIGRIESCNAIDMSLINCNNQIILASQKDIMIDFIELDNIENTGVVCEIISYADKIGVTNSHDYLVELKALFVVNLTNIFFDQEKNCFIADIEALQKEIVNNKLIFKDSFVSDNLENLNFTIILLKLKKLVDEENFPIGLYKDLIITSQSVGSKVEKIVYTMATFLPFLPKELKQQILEEVSDNKNFWLLFNYIKCANSLAVEEEINLKIKNRIDDQQREYLLREKMRTIKEELNEKDQDLFIPIYLQRLQQENFPANIKKRVKEEISRYEAIPQVSIESNIIKNYIDVIMNLPWYKKSKETMDLKKARIILDTNHFGLEKIKDRIIEYLAVCKMTKSLKSQIICFLGYPGVGKTSLSKSIACALNRSFVKITVGGIKDESEIRGHRRTYISAMPGRILQVMKKAKTINPVFLIDEIDKMSSDYRGDPASAMLEVLDPTQNHEFSDNYLEEPYDLSNVMFIATANYIDNIPKPLLDRMEIIELSSYTELEKIEIAQKHLIPKVIETHGLEKELIVFNEDAIAEIIRHYTRESGVRELERVISKITRKFIVKLLNKELKEIIVDLNYVAMFLGQREYEFTMKHDKLHAGVVTGLAYTSFGGDIIEIEVENFAGTGLLILTGKLGEVMKESANTALSYIKSNINHFKIKSDWFKTHDIHIHVPEGAVSKDGPSAGITITTAIISSILKHPVSKDIGMTGEITLVGNILQIGGLKEKTISAKRAGLKTILIPKTNQKDIEEIPEEIKNFLNIVFVEKYDEVFQFIFNK